MHRSLSIILLVVWVALAACQPLPAASAAPEILWDRWGVPHITAQTPAQAFRLFGWAQAKHHGSLLLQLYAQGRGRAAATYGPAYLDSDRAVWQLDLPARAAAWYAAQRADFRANLDAFAQGINDYAAAHPTAWDAEARSLLPVTGVDVVAHTTRVLTMFVTSITECRTLLPGMALDHEPGSNAWAIAPGKSADGHAMLLANPHLAWSGAQTFCEAHLMLPDANIYGATLVGFPVLAIAFNDHLGWTHTVNTIDGCDLFALELVHDDPAQGYRLDDEVLPLELTTVPLQVRQEDGTLLDTSVEVGRSVHGPVIRQPDGVYAVRAAMLEVLPIAGLNQQWWDMGHATNMEEFRAIIARRQLPMFTIMYADRAGNIQAIFNGQVPVRAEGDALTWFGPVAGNQRHLIWQEVHALDDLPQVINPDSGWAQNSNSAPWTMTLPMLDATRYPAYMSQQVFDTREQRGLRMLMEDEAISLEEMITYKHSSYAQLADHVLPALVEAAADHDDTAVVAAAQVLAQWDRQFDQHSQGALLFTFWFQNWLRASFPGVWSGEEELAPMDLMGDRLFAQPWDPAQPLTTPHGLADPDLAVRALAEAAAGLQALGLALDTPWGDFARLQRGPHDLPGNGGDGTMGIFRVMTYVPVGPGQFEIAFGDTYIAAVEFATPVRAQVLMTYGNATEAGSPFVGDQLELAANKQLRPALLTRAAIEAELYARETFTP